MDLLLVRREAVVGGRFWLLLGAVLIALVTAPATALAAGSVSVSGNTVTYSGGGADNVLGVSFDGTDYVLSESGITAGSGCTAGTDQATCPANGLLSINAGAGNDTVTLGPSVAGPSLITGGAGDDVITGGAGPDTVSYATSPSGVTVNLSRTDAQDTGGAGIDTLANVDNLDGSPFADVLTGNSGPNAISGFAGDDQIDSTDGQVNDSVNCGPGAADRFAVDPGDAVAGCEDDGVPPGVQITSGPPDLSGSRSAAFEFVSGDPNLDHFECSIDGAAPAPCGSPATYDLGDGTHTFAVQGVDRFGHIGPQASAQWSIDVGAPNINIDSAPSGTITTSSATFAFSSPDGDLKRFDCSVDGSDWVECESPVTLSFLPDGPHTFGVRAVDTAGNVGVLTLSFTVAAAKSGPGIVSRPANSLVLIAGKTVKVSKRGYAYIALNCSGTRDCAGKVLLDTAKKVRSGRKKRIVRLGHAKFKIRAQRTRRVRIHISKSKLRLLRKLRKVNTDIVVRDRDGAGRARVSSRTIMLRAPSRR